MLIGFCGGINVGKTTAAEFLSKRYGFHHLSFGRPVKLALIAATGLPEEYFYDQTYKNIKLEKWGLTPRELMQKFATDFFREMIHKDFWVHRMQSELENIWRTNVTKHIVIDDIRAPNEVELIHKYGGDVICLERDFEKLEQPGDKHKFENFELNFNERLYLPDGIDKANQEVDGWIISEIGNRRSSLSKQGFDRELS